MHRDLSHERFSFGGFELDVAAYELRRDGGPIRLERQPMDLLILLVERRGELVSRSDISARLWARGVFVDVDMAINTAVRKIRLALGDSPEVQSLVQTVPGKGYRFVAAVEVASYPPARLSGPRFPARLTVWRGAVAAIAGFLALVVTLATWIRSTPVLPRVTGTTQITSDHVAKFGPVSDGSRLYFNEMPQPRGTTLAQVAAGGGDVAPLAIPLSRPIVVDISPDGSELLVTGYREPPVEPAPIPELWIVPVVAGNPRRVGDLRALDATWSSDRRSIAYTNGTPGVFLGNSDGSGSRKVWTAGGPCRWPAVSHEGRTLRLTVFGPDRRPSLWEVDADGRNPHPLLPGFASPACCGRWTSDGKYFVFGAFDLAHGTPDVWVRREGTNWMSRTPAGPHRLTQGPIHFFNPMASRDGRKIFAVGWQQRGELVRYDPRAMRFESYLAGISAFEVEFSRDGLWVVYVSYPDGTLFRSRADGSERLALTRPPLRAEGPGPGGPPDVAASTHWSPDGKRIVFLGTADLKTTAYLVSTDGGLPEPVPMPDDHAWVPRSWSPDGATLALGRSGDPAAPIQLLDLRTGHPLKVPGSEGLIVPLWSPDGRRLAALSGDRERLVLYDFASSRWHDLLTGKERLSFPTWSRDSLSLFLSEGEARIRVVAADGRRAAVATFDGLRRPVTTGGWVGRAPDDSVITLRDLGLQEIFALDWEAP